MNIHEGIAGLKALPPGSVLSIGNFDGVHRGHLAIIELARELKFRDQMRDLNPTGRVAIVTFEPHPLMVLAPDKAPPRLTPSALKRQLLAAVGVDDLVILPPTREVLDVSAEDFFKILRDETRPAHLIEGERFNFGRGREGSIARLREWSRGTSMQLHVIDSVEVTLLDQQIVEVNSSLIRWLIAQGRVRDASICLGRPYTISGRVIEGAKRGRTIGVPTANLQIDDQLIPADGVYAARTIIDRKSFDVALSIGPNATFDGGKRQVEAHLLNFNGDLYGQTISLDVIDWIRDQQKFPGIDALKERINRDLQVVRTRADESEEFADTDEGFFTADERDRN